MTANGITVRTGASEDVSEIVKLSNEILDYLRSKDKSDFFGGVDENEVRAAMIEPSTVFVACDKQERMVGFLLLQLPNAVEEELYKKDFETIFVKNSLILNGYGVKPELHNQDIAKTMLQKAKAYACKNKFMAFIGTMHPDNMASFWAMSTIAKGYQESEDFLHHTRDGRELLRARFLLEL